MKFNCESIHFKVFTFFPHFTNEKLYTYIYIYIYIYITQVSNFTTFSGGNFPDKFWCQFEL